MTSTGEYSIHLIQRESIHSRIRTGKVFRVEPGEPLIEETPFAWIPGAMLSSTNEVPSRKRLQGVERTFQRMRS